MTSPASIRAKAAFLEEVAKLGYARLGLAVDDPAGSQWYAMPPGESGLRQFLLLLYKPRYEAFGVMAGVEFSEARARVDRAQKILERFLHPSISEPGFRVLQRPCLLTFDIGRALNWTLLAVPDPLKPEALAGQLDQLVGLLTKEFWSITTPQLLYDVVNSDVAPFDWAGSQAVLRAAIVVSIGKSIGKSDAALRDALTQHQTMIKIHMLGEKDADSLIGEFVSKI